MRSRGRDISLKNGASDSTVAATFSVDRTQHAQCFRHEEESVDTNQKRAYLGRPRHILQEQREVLAAERSQNIPEPLNLLVSGLEVGVLGVVLSWRDILRDSWEPGDRG